MVSSKTAIDGSLSQECEGSQPSRLVAEGRLDLESNAESEEIEERVSSPQQVYTQKVYSAKWGVFQRCCKNT
jgi:hypothetical protein